MVAQYYINSDKHRLLQQLFILSHSVAEPKESSLESLVRTSRIPLQTGSPGLILTLRMYFSPRKLRISTSEPFSWMTTLMGK